MKIVKKNQLEIAIFTAVKNRCILHECVFVITLKITNILDIMLRNTCNVHVDPLTPQFYKVNVGFTGVCKYVFIFALEHRLCLPVRPEAILSCTHNLCFEQKYKKN